MAKKRNQDDSETKDSEFALKVWMVELKDCVLEVTSAKHHVHMELLNVWKGSLQVYKSAFWQEN